MNKDEHFSEEQLNAFVDGELEPEEKSRLYNESAHSPDLDQRLCQQRKVKELVQHAYEDVPPARGTGGTPIVRGGFFSRALVASVLIGVGLAGGFIAHNLIAPGQGDGPLTLAAGGQAVVESNNYLLHVVSGEPEEMMAALEHARYLLETADDGEVRQVEIIANEQGLNLLREDITPFANEITTLQKNDVVLYACSKTIQRLEEKGVEVILVPEANPNYTALDRVVTRMQEGWKYEKI